MSDDGSEGDSVTRDASGRALSEQEARVADALARLLVASIVKELRAEGYPGALPSEPKDGRQP